MKAAKSKSLGEYGTAWLSLRTYQIMIDNLRKHYEISKYRKEFTYNLQKCEAIREELIFLQQHLSKSGPLQPMYMPPPPKGSKIITNGNNNNSNNNDKSSGSIHNNVKDIDKYGRTEVIVESLEDFFGDEEQTSQQLKLDSPRRRRIEEERRRPLYERKIDIIIKKQPEGETILENQFYNLEDCQVDFIIIK